MAKRYFGFSTLRDVNGKFKPSGTMGSHCCTVVASGDLLVVVGSAGGRVTLREGDTLGYDCGIVWLVPRPESYRDPIRRILAEKHLSQKILLYSDKPIGYTQSFGQSCRNTAADFETGERLRDVLGQYTDQEIPGAYWSDREVNGGEAVIMEKVASFEVTTYRRRKIYQIIVRAKADKAKVAKWLSEVL